MKVLRGAKKTASCTDLACHLGEKKRSRKDVRPEIRRKLGGHIAPSGNACHGPGECPPPCTDLDGDGYGNPASVICRHSEWDCDDSDPGINPGVTEATYGELMCSDSADNDCDGHVDVDDNGCRPCTNGTECDDGNPYTADACLEGVCSYTDYPVIKDVPYLPGSDDTNHLLDVFAPAGATEAPVVFYVHGGGWSFNRKEMSANIGDAMTEHGYVAVVPNYTRADEAPYPAFMRDLAAAFAWTYRNIGEYGGNPDAIFVSGHSAGGHMACLLAMDPGFLEEAGMTAGAVKGVMALSAIYDLVQYGLDFMVEPVFGPDQDVWLRASPLKLVRHGLPPFLVLYAQWESGNLTKQAVTFAEALRESGNSVVEVELGGENHFGEIYGDLAVVPPMLTFTADVLASGALVRQKPAP